MKSFILCVNLDKDSWYGEEGLFEILKSGEYLPTGIYWSYKDGSKIEENDLTFIMDANNPSLIAVGKAISDYELNEPGLTVLIQTDFIQAKDFTMFSSLLKKACVTLPKAKQELLLAPELAETLMKRFAAVHMACSHPHSFLAFNPNGDKKQLLCDYLNDFCPEFRQEVIKRFPLVYHNYKEGEIIDRSLIDLTYDKTVTGFPGGILDWNRLFDIVRPRA